MSNRTNRPSRRADLLPLPEAPAPSGDAVLPSSGTHFDVAAKAVPLSAIPPCETRRLRITDALPLSDMGLGPAFATLRPLLQPPATASGPAVPSAIRAAAEMADLTVARALPEAERPVLRAATLAAASADNLVIQAAPAPQVTAGPHVSDVLTAPKSTVPQGTAPIEAIPDEPSPDHTGPIGALPLEVATLAAESSYAVSPIPGLAGPHFADTRLADPGDVAADTDTPAPTGLSLAEQTLSLDAPPEPRSSPQWSRLADILAAASHQPVDLSEALAEVRSGQPFPALRAGIAIEDEDMPSPPPPAAALPTAPPPIARPVAASAVEAQSGIPPSGPESWAQPAPVAPAARMSARGSLLALDLSRRSPADPGHGRLPPPPPPPPPAPTFQQAVAAGRAEATTAIAHLPVKLPVHPLPATIPAVQSEAPPAQAWAGFLTGLVLALALGAGLYVYLVGI